MGEWQVAKDGSKTNSEDGGSGYPGENDAG